MAEKVKSKSKSKGGDEATVKLHKTKDPHLLKKILKGGSEHIADEIDGNGELPIHAYVRSNDKRKFECLMTYLIHRKCDINHQSEEGVTALHLACDINDLLSAKALISFGADINSLNLIRQTPLDIVHEKYRSNSPISDILNRIGGRSAAAIDVDSDDDDDVLEVTYELTSTGDSFTMKPVDPQELSARLTAVGSLEREDTDYHEYNDHPGILDLALPSLPEDDGASSAEKKKRFATPDASVEMGLTMEHLSVMMASGKITVSPPSSLDSDSTDRGYIPVGKRLSPKTPSPLTSSLTHIEESHEGEEEVREPETAVNGHTEDTEECYSPEEHADVIPGGAIVEPSSPPGEQKRLINYGFVGGSLINELESNTEAVLNQGIEDSTGDEGYAAWLQYREIERAKKASSGFMEDSADSKETKKENPTPPKQSTPSPKPKRRSETVPARGCKAKVMKMNQLEAAPPTHTANVKVSTSAFNRDVDVMQSGLGRSAMPRVKVNQQLPTESVMLSMSTVNRDMDVMQSVLGRSVMPRVVKKARSINGQSVLCLDGGGIKGLVQIEILIAIERITGKRITELFDWIVGTSTGGILALGLVYAGLELEDLRRMYFEMKDSVFRRKSKVVSQVCDTEALEELLKKTLGTDKCMNSEQKPNVMITAVDKKDTRLPLVFFNNCFHNEYSTQPVWKVARYTSAAPVFFKECENYVDGGVVANNPTSYAMAEIQEHFKKQTRPGVASPEISCVVSIGCGIYPPEPLGVTNITDAIKVRKMITSPNAAANTFKDLLTLLTTALTQSEGVARICGINCEQQGIPYYRFSPEMGEDVGTAETDNVKLCDMIISAKAMIEECADHVKNLSERLECKPAATRRRRHDPVV